MLRITASENGSVVAIKLEGQIIGPWIAELRETCARYFADDRLLRLDLGEVTFAEREAAGLIAELRERRFMIEGASTFLREQLALAGPITRRSTRRRRT